MKREFEEVFERLSACYGPQQWWPADSPFEVMVGAVLTQNTAWTNVERAIANLRANQALAPEAILSAPTERLAAWLKPSGYFNVKARRLQNFCAWYLDQGGYQRLRRWDTARLRRGLLSVSGVGPETADDILLYAFARPVFVVDAYTRRIFTRLGILEEGLDYEGVRARFEERLAAAEDPVALFNEYHALIVQHGKGVCRPRPRCDECCLRAGCAGSG